MSNVDKNAPQNITYYSKIYDLAFYVLGTEENLIESNVNVTNKEVMKGDLPMTDGINVFVPAILKGIASLIQQATFSNCGKVLLTELLFMLITIIY